MGITVTVSANFIYSVASAGGDNGIGGGGTNPGTNGALASFVNTGGTRTVTPGYGGGAANGGGNALTVAHEGLNHGAGWYVFDPAEQLMKRDTNPTVPGGGAPGAWLISNQSTTNTNYSFNGLAGANGRVQVSFTFDIEDLDPDS